MYLTFWGDKLPQVYPIPFLMILLTSTINVSDLISLDYFTTPLLLLLLQLPIHRPWSQPGWMNEWTNESRKEGRKPEQIYQTYFVKLFSLALLPLKEWNKKNELFAIHWESLKREGERSHLKRVFLSQSSAYTFNKNWISFHFWRRITHSLTQSLSFPSLFNQHLSPQVPNDMFEGGKVWKTWWFRHDMQLTFEIWFEHLHGIMRKEEKKKKNLPE